MFSAYELWLYRALISSCLPLSCTFHGQKLRLSVQLQPCLSLASVVVKHVLLETARRHTLQLKPMCLIMLKCLCTTVLIQFPICSFYLACFLSMTDCISSGSSMSPWAVACLTCFVFSLYFAGISFRLQAVFVLHIMFFLIKCFETYIKVMGHTVYNTI